MRLLIVQYAGDYRETVKRFYEGGEETYCAQKYSVDAVAEIGKQIEEAAVLCCLTAEPYDEVLQNGVRAIGAGFNQKIQLPKLIELIEKQKPTHLIVRTPIREVLSWAIKNKVPMIALLADSFPNQGLRKKVKNYLLANLLNNKPIQWVFNHGINSCLSLQEIGVKPSKIIPWDFPHPVSPDSLSPKILRTDANPWQLIYVGLVTKSKGVGEVLEAIKQLKEKKLSLKLKIVGLGETEYFINQAKQLQIEDCVEFMGLLPNKTIVPLMREADIVLVPSRHEYPEGFPLTIYEGLCSRTPIIASDHPMFKNNLKDGSNAMIFPAGNASALSACVEKLLSDPALYHSLSLASLDAWKRLQIPVKWAELINRWVYDSQENRQWLFDHRLDSGRYRSTFE